MTELDPAVVKRTQETLGKFVKKPPLTEKLLRKPPFRFLHDVFNVVIKDTGCFEGLYTPDELDFEHIKDRDDKMRFLQKMIDVIKITTNTPITVRASKIVAGQEPEKTNELLQLMGAVIAKKLDWKSAVEKVRKDSKGQEKEKAHTKLKSQEKPKDKATDKTKDKEQKTTKDGRIRETKGSTKTTSPTTKTEKPKKPIEPKEKISRTTKDKTGKDLKEKAVQKSRETTEKSKPAKSRADVKEKSPSPVKVDVVKEENMEAAVFENRGKVESKEPGKPVKVNSEIQEQGRTGNAAKLERRNSKILHEIQAQPPADASMSDVSNAIEPKVEKFEVNEVRKSSAQRKGSSGKKRRSNASNAAKEERDRDAAQQPVTSSSNFESLSALKEEEAPQVTKAAAQPTPVPPQQHAQPEQPPAQPPSPSAAPGHHSSAELKRESTFTRENSKDSTGNETNRPRTSLRPPSARPASARPGAPRRRDKNVEIVLQPNDPVKMSGINVKLETFGDLDDDGENLVIIEDANAANITGAGAEVRAEVSGENNLEQQGHLVQQILETQKELMQQNGGNGSGKNEKENDAGSALSGRQSSARQMNNLRDIIQNLTKSVNPFGKLMDFIPEDIDAMQLEMTMWRDSYTQAANELRREKSLTESATEPMKNQLVQIEASIKEYLEMVDASRTKIMQNSEKILKMLTEQ